MVKSNLISTINYSETKTMNVDDELFDASVYDADFLGVPIVIAVGQMLNTYLDSDGIVYFPIYLINSKESVECQIGVYEILSSELQNVVDDDGDPDISEMGNPLLFSSFVTKLFLENYKNAEIEKPNETTDPSSKKTSDPSEIKSADEDEGEGEEIDKEIDQKHEKSDIQEKDSETLEDGLEIKKSDDGLSKITPQSKYTPLPEQTKHMAMEEETSYEQHQHSKDKSPLWIQKFFKSMNYSIIDNEGGGDCLFLALKNGLERVGINISVTEMRKKLATEATQALFRNYEQIYNDFKKEIDASTKEISNIVKMHSELKERLQKTKDGSLQRTIIQQAKEYELRHTEAVKELKLAKQNIKEFTFMKGITTLEAFKAKIQTCDFWADTWAISTLERILNIKIIILSSKEFLHGRTGEVLQCGNLNDTVLQDKGVFTPSHYIMLDYMGNHYKLITYKTRGALTFKELPLAIKNICVDKCMERMGGAYALIPEFVEYMKEKNKVITTEDISPSDLYDNNTVFQFYSKSKHVMPGKGSGEKLGGEGKEAYLKLSTIEDWRRMLSNFWIKEFTLDGMRWSSVEHYYQASKFKKGNPEFYSAFSLDGKDSAEKVITDPVLLHKLPIDANLAKSIGGKTGKIKIKGQQKTITMDKDFDSRKSEEMKKAMFAKFNQNAELKQMLILTKKAKLQHFSRGSPPIIFTELMQVRRELQ